MRFSISWPPAGARRLLSTQHSGLSTPLRPGGHPGIDRLPARNPLTGEFVLLHLRADDDIAPDRDVRGDAGILADERDPRIHPARFEHVRRVIVAVAHAAA